MKYILSYFLFFVLTFAAFGQHSVSFKIQDISTKEPLVGVSIRLNGTKLGTTSNADGKAQLNNISTGSQRFTFSFVGYQTLLQRVVLPTNDTLLVQLTPAAELLEEVRVESTRSNRTIDDIPTRIEVLTDEIDEAASMEPSRIAHLMTHSTGLQVQTTSAGSNSAVVRIQGLGGRYTKMLKDGFPLYGGFSGSLDIMQIPPLDLRQIEFIKGSASTLYGGGAIAGVINLLSKTPVRNETLLHINQSSIGSSDFNAFVSQRKDKWGVTMLANYHLHAPYDADEDGFSDVPNINKFTFNPKLYYYASDQHTFYLGATLTSEFRNGGDMLLLKNQAPDSQNFYEDSQTSKRIATQFKYEYRIAPGQTLTLKNSFNVFDRFLQIRRNDWGKLATFDGRQTATFTEITYNYARSEAHEWIFGANVITDDFQEKNVARGKFPRDENQQTFSAFINNLWQIAPRINLESGLRLDNYRGAAFDNTAKRQFFVMPRVSVLVKYSDKLTSRFGGGLGYRPPTIFNEESEPFGFQNILPIDFRRVDAEQSFGLNADIVYKTSLGPDKELSINQMFFNNIVQNQLVLRFADLPRYGDDDLLEYDNYGYITSRGFETQFKLIIRRVTWFVGYTFTDAFDYTGKQLILTPRHSIKGDFLYTIAGKWRFAADYELKSRQRLSDATLTPNLFMAGITIERTIGDFVLFFNAENFTDTRQTRYQSLRSGPSNTPQFTEVWAPLDGRFLNIGLKVKL